MIHKYALAYNGKKVGAVVVERNGRFYRIGCRFVLPDKNVVRLIVDCGENCIDLGACMKYGDQLGIVRYFPIDKIGEAPMRFYLLEDKMFVPVCDVKPFTHLDKLINGHFEIRSGIKGIVLEGSGPEI